MNMTCMECCRLLQVSDSALKSYTLILGLIYEAGDDQDTTLRMKLKPDVQEAANLRTSTRRAFDFHNVKHHKDALLSRRLLKNVAWEVRSQWFERDPSVRSQQP